MLLGSIRCSRARVLTLACALSFSKHKHAQRNFNHQLVPVCVRPVPVQVPIRQVLFSVPFSPCKIDHEATRNDTALFRSVGAGCLAIWLTGWPSGWLPGWLSGWLLGWLSGWLGGWFAPVTLQSVDAQSGTSLIPV